MYSKMNFYYLEKMTDDELKGEVRNAKRHMDEIVKAYEELEREMREECILLYPSLDILFRQLKNIEAYIRKAENLLENWDDYSYINKVRNNKYVLLNRQLTYKPIVKIKMIKLKGGE